MIGRIKLLWFPGVFTLLASIDMPLTKRPNARVSKSFTGCLRCKERKKKCDESPHSCLTCLRANEVCPGYVQKLRWSRKHELFEEQNDSRGKTARRETGKSIVSIETGGRNDAQQSPSPAGSYEIEELQDTDFPAAHHQYDLDLMFSQWLNAEFLPRDDLPLLGLNLPLGQSGTQASVAGDGILWPTLDDLQGLQLPLNPYQGLQTLSETCDCHPETGNAPIADDHRTSHRFETTPDPGRGSCLETFYRMSSPTPYARFSADHLVKHYFTDVCSLVSCFDSSLNPFRTLVAEELKRSSTVSLSIQSMSIAHLANHYLYMAPLGMAKRCLAWKSLQVDLQRHRAGQVPLETVLLSLLLLGFSAPWHQPANLGLPYLYIMRTLMQRYFRGGHNAADRTCLKNEKFFVDSLMHWEMLASFLDPFPMRGFPGFGMPDLQTSNQEQHKLLHPWTGICTELHFALAEVGRILRRRQRKSITPTEQNDPDSLAVLDERWAAKLEQFLRSIRLPTIDDVVDYNDEETPKSDLVRIAHAQRYVGLLEIYAAFPHLYEEALKQRTSFPLLYDRQIDRSADDAGNTQTPRDSFSAIAMNILEIVNDISVTSSACRFLSLILVSCACQLRIPDLSKTTVETQSECHNQDITARFIVESRLLALSTKYPQRQMLQILEIVKEVWDRLDNDQLDKAHWMDVMQEKNLQTMIG